MRSLVVIDSGVMPYRDTLALQKKVLMRKKRGMRQDCLILAEHNPVFTIGRRGNAENILADSSFLKEESLEVLYADRGGDVTFHGLGQAVFYPIFDLRNHAKDIRLFIYNLEEVIVRVIADYGPKAFRDSRHRGVWVKEGKIGFIGIGVSSWITYHGISLNINNDLRYFSMIRPCGIEGVSVTSLSDILGVQIDINVLKNLIIKNFCKVFDFEECFYEENAFLDVEAYTGLHQG